ncbi:MAG: hypothetical protein AAFV25_04675, partial [Bacteroidota bacterium]
MDQSEGVAATASPFCTKNLRYSDPSPDKISSSRCSWVSVMKTCPKFCSNYSPVLLLDDIFDKLDRQRVRQLVEL